MNLGGIRHVLVISTAVGILTFSFIKTQAIDPEKHNAISGNLRELKALDAALDRDILRARFHHLNNYDPLVLSFVRLHDHLDLLRNGPMAIYRQGSEDVDTRIEQYVTLETHRYGLQERFKSANAILRNSMLYFPTLASETARELRQTKGGGAFARPIDDLLEKILLLNVHADSEILAKQADALIERLTALSSRSPVLTDKINTILVHAKNIVAKKKEIDQLLSNFLALPVQKINNELFQLYNKSNLEIEQNAKSYQVLLYIISSMLALYLVYLLIYLGQTNKLVQKQAKEVEQALATEKEHSQMQRQFVSMASHEFRTPLTIIDGSAQRILRRIERVTPDELTERMGKIRNAVARMNVLIESTLNSARIGAGNAELDLRPCRIKDLVNEICERQQDISPNHTIQTELDALPNEIIADAKQLDHVFTNLLSNAVKFSPDSPLVQVCGHMDGTETVIAIADSGVGIPEDELPKMFSRFFRASTSAGIAGTGIGLNLVKTLLKLHGGRIELDSQVGKGTTFAIYLPIDGPPATETELGTEQNTATAPMVA